MSSLENTVDLKGRVVKWLPDKNWGLINFYREGGSNEAPRKVFLHSSKVTGDARPQMGSRVIFDLGPARSANELPQALRVRVRESARRFSGQAKNHRLVNHYKQTVGLNAGTILAAIRLAKPCVLLTGDS